MLNWEQNKWNYIHHWELPCSDWCPAPHPTSWVKWWEVSHSKNKNQTWETKQISHFVLFKGLKKPQRTCVYKHHPLFQQLVLPDTCRGSAHSELNLPQYILSFTLRRQEWTIYLGSENTRSQQWRDLLWEKTTSSLKLSKTNQNRLRDKEIFETTWKSKDHPITRFSVYLPPHQHFKITWEFQENVFERLAKCRPLRSSIYLLTL